mgnify:CR=1 FL=1
MLGKAAQKLGEIMYAEAQAKAQPAEAGGGDAKKEEKVVDAEYTGIVDALRDLREAGCDLVTITQYLRPSTRHHPVERWVRPEEFVDLAANASDVVALSTITIATPGVCEDGRTTTEQPAASAGATLRAIRAAGKFQAVKTATMPTGS